MTDNTGNTGNTGLDTEEYVVTDGFFGRPYIDVDEEREKPAPHRHVHGGFHGTDTRFTFYYPPARQYHGRMYHPLEGANAGHEDSFGNEHGNLLGGLEMIIRLGGYMVESNMGHIGDVLDPKAGEDATVYAFRAAAESARFSKFIAVQIYGEAPHHSYVWGGSGGGRRSPGCLEYGTDVWDGALPFMGGGEVEEHGEFRPLKWTSNFPVMFNVQRLLGDKLLDVIDAVSPGGSGDPFTGLDTHQREELANLYRTGFPRGDEWVIGQPSGVIWQWCSMADALQSDDDYYEAFWIRPGHVGHDQPELVAGDLIDRPATVRRVFCAQDFLDDPELQRPEYERLRPRALMLAGTRGFDLPIAVEIPGASSSGYLLGCNVRVKGGRAAGRSLYVMYSVGDLMVCDGAGEASNLRFTDVSAGDEVHLDNHAFLAHCYYSRHHLSDEAKWDFMRVDGAPIYPQHELPPNSPFMGVAYSGQYEGKLLWVHHTHDASLWPSDGVVYQAQVLRAQGPEAAARKFRIRWTENAEHVPAEFVPSMPTRSSSTWLVDYRPVIEQSLADLAAWVEEGVVPAATTFRYSDGRVTLPPTAAERGGVQAVVRVTANGGSRAEVKVGEPVTLMVHAETPPGAGTIIDAAWDFDGSGSYPFHHDDIDGTDSDVTLTTSHAWDRAGTYFATCLVHSHVDGDVDATSRRLPNLASARVIVS